MSPAFGSLFGSKKPPLGTPTFGAYGKLPLSKEFLRIRCTDGAGHAIYQWINEGFDAAVREGGGRAPDVGEWEILTYPDGFKEAAAITIRGSADHGGERVFPFACFALVPRERVGETSSKSIALVGELFRQLWEADARLAGSADRTAFRDAAMAVELSGAGTGDDPQDVRSERLWQDSMDTGAAIATLYEVARAVRVITSGKVPGARLPALRLPRIFASRPPAQSCVRAWLDLLQATPLFRGRRTPVSIAAPRRSADEDAAAPACWLVPRPLRPSDLEMLASSDQGLFFPDPGGELARVELEPWHEFRERASASIGAPETTLGHLARFELIR